MRDETDSMRGTVAVVGVAKNCGKTTTLNALLRTHQHRRVGLVSIGIDGESRDFLIGTDKPSISVYEGQWVVSSREGFERSSAQVEYVQELGYTTPMGPVYLAQVKAPGEVLLSGIRHAQDLLHALSLMRAHGADPCFIDGAYGRTVGARSDLAEHVIVSTGAIVSSSLQEVMHATISLTNRLTCPAPPHAWQHDLMREAVLQERTLIGGESLPATPLAMRSALTALTRSRGLWTAQAHAIAVPGLVSNRVLEELLLVSTPSDAGRRTLIVEDGTRIQVDYNLMQRFERSWDVCATSRVQLRGISYNPTSIAGMSLDADAFRDALRAHFGEEMWIFNPVVV